MKKKKKVFLLKINFFIILLLGLLIFTGFSFLIVIQTQNNPDNLKPREISCSDLNIIESEILKIFPKNIFLTKDLDNTKDNFLISWILKEDTLPQNIPAEKVKTIIIKNQSAKDIKKILDENLEISLLGYGIYSDKLNTNNIDKYGYKKKNYIFSIFKEQSSNFDTGDKQVKLPENSEVLILKCGITK